jgi:hypothetical protein
MVDTRTPANELLHKTGGEAEGHPAGHIEIVGGWVARSRMLGRFDCSVYVQAPPLQTF